MIGNGKLTAVFLATAVAVGAGFVILDERRAWSAPTPAAKPATAVPGAVPAAEVARAFRTNAAMVDAQYLGRRTVVNGQVVSVRRTDDGQYALLLKGNRDTLLGFAFEGEEARATLAGLAEGDMVTVAGTPDGGEIHEARGKAVVPFSGCEMVRAGR